MHRHLRNHMLLLNRQSEPFTPESIFAGGEVGDYWETGDLSTLFQNSAGSTPVAADGDPVGRWNGKRGVWHVLQAGGNKPIWDATTKAVKSYEGNCLANSNFAVPATATDFSVFSYHKRSGAAGIGNFSYIGVSRVADYNWSYGFIGCVASPNHTKIAHGAGLANFYDGNSLPAETNFNSYAMSLNNTHSTSYLNGGADQNSNNALPTTQASDPSGANDFLMAYTDEPGRYLHQKFLLIVRRVLTAAEVQALHDYASALP